MKDFQNRYSAIFRRAVGRPGTCPPADALASLAAGRAWPWRRRRLAGHLSRCSRCADDYRVLVAARGGLIGALEAQAGGASGQAPGWLRTGLAAGALAGITALGIAMLVETGSPGPWSGPDTMAANGFESSAGQPPAGAEDRVFNSDFGEPEPADAPLFRDNFGG